MEGGSPVSPQNEYLSVEVTTACNSSCSHCFVRARGARGSSLAPQLVKALIREGYDAGYRRVHVTGGEPLLWAGLLSFFDYAFGLGYETALLNTNGTLLTGGVSRRLAAYKGLSISVTLQGPKRLHDRVRGKGSYDRALKGIEHAINAELPIYVFTPVARSLIPYLPHFAERLFKALPAIKQLVLIQLIRVPGDVFDLSREVLRPDDFLKLVRMISLLNLYALRVGLLNNPLAAVASKLLGMPPVPSSAPLYRPGSVLITAEKRITLAHSTTDGFGIYEPGMLSKIMNSAEYRSAVSPDPLCGNCVYSKPCGSEGMARPSEWYRDMRPEIPYCRRVLAKASSYG